MSQKLDIRPLLEFEKITEEDIKELEKFLKAKLPNDYKEFLLKYNGGFPRSYYCDLADGKRKVMPTDGYAISKTQAIDLKHQYQNARQHLNIFPDLLPIADNGCGDLVCIRIGKKDHGKMYMWYHDLSPVEPSYDYLICNSFTEFLAKLYKKED